MYGEKLDGAFTKTAPAGKRDGNQSENIAVQSCFK